MLVRQWHWIQPLQALDARCIFDFPWQSGRELTCLPGSKIHPKSGVAVATLRMPRTSYAPSVAGQNPLPTVGGQRLARRERRQEDFPSLVTVLSGKARVGNP